MLNLKNRIYIFLRIFLLNILGLGFAFADNLTYVCESGENLVVSYSSDAKATESKISLTYKQEQIELANQPSLVDTKYTIYTNAKYEWWEFIEEDAELGILFESKEGGNILENCKIEHLPSKTPPKNEPK